MNDNEALVAVVSVICVILAPIIAIGHYVTKWRAMKAAQPDAAETEALRAMARRMEARIENLESILDAQAPGWRARSGTR